MNLNEEQKWSIARLAFWFLDRGRWSHAESLARGLLTLDQRDGQAWLYYGEARRQQDDIAEAARAFSEAAKLLEHRSDIWMRLGDSLIRLGRYDEARAALENGLTCVDGDPGLRRRINALLEMCKS